MTNKRFTRYLAMLLVIVLLVQAVPTQVFAASDDSSGNAEETQQEELNESAPIPNEQLDSMENIEILGELTDRRTEFSKEFALSNGLNMTTVYPGAVHFEKEG